MKYFAGLDVSLQETAICVVDEDGIIVTEGKTASDPDDLGRWLAATGLAITRVGLEAGPLSPWLHAGLRGAGLPAICIETRRMKGATAAMAVKTDRNDARAIAHAMRVGWFTIVHVKTAESQELRLLLSNRRVLLEKQIAIDNEIRGTLKAFGLKVGPVCFAVSSGSDTTVFNFVEGQVAADPGTPAFILAAPEATWARFLEPVPPRHHHGIFAMMYRVPEFSIQGDQLAFMQHAHVARRVLEIGKWLALGRALPVPASLHPREGARAVPLVTGRYVPVTVGGVTYQIYSESAGSGQDVLCMHTAGADGRQFHGLMADPRIVEHPRLVSFALPWHGKSPPPDGAIQGSWRLNTDLYVALIMGFA